MGDSLICICRRERGSVSQPPTPTDSALAGDVLNVRPRDPRVDGRKTHCRELMWRLVTKTLPRPSRTPNSTFLLEKQDANLLCVGILSNCSLHCQCPLMAQSGHPRLRRTCPLSGVKRKRFAFKKFALDDWSDPVSGCPLSGSLLAVKRTCCFAPHMSANDPKRTCVLVWHSTSKSALLTQTPTPWV